MTNNQLCSLIGACGCAILFISMVLMFFGITPAIWGAGIGALTGIFALVNYN